MQGRRGLGNLLVPVSNLQLDEAAGSLVVEVSTRWSGCVRAFVYAVVMLGAEGDRWAAVHRLWLLVAGPSGR